MIGLFLAVSDLRSNTHTYNIQCFFSDWSIAESQHTAISF